MTRPGAQVFIERFPGGAAFRWRNLLAVERALGLVRVAALVVSAAVCLTAAPPDPPLARTVFAAGCAYVLFSPLLLHRPRSLPASVRAQLLVLLDMLLILGAVVATGSGRSVLMPLIFVGAASAPIRLATVGGLATPAVYALAWVALAQPPQRAMAVFVALTGLMIALVVRTVRGVAADEARDPLTHCFGRRPASLFIEHLLATRSLPFSAVLLDFDGFKQINDRFGHPAGDHALVALADLVARSIRPRDLLARLGGDEFLIVAPETDGAAALALAERIRSAVNDTPLALTAVRERPRLSCSAGVAEAAAGDTAETLLERADRHLYLAKERRNHVILAGATPANAIRGS